MRTDIYFSLRFQLDHRAMRYKRYLALNRLIHILMERMCRALPSCWMPIADLSHLETRTYPDRLASVRDGWEKTKQIPILVYADPGGLQLWNGNHRLTAARETGAETVKVCILAYNPPFTKAVNRERAIFDEMRREDQQGTHTD